MHLRDILIDFGLPLVIITFAFVLLLTGIDGEVKSILTIAAGWAFHGAIRAKR